ARPLAGHPRRRTTGAAHLHRNPGDGIDTIVVAAKTFRHRGAHETGLNEIIDRLARDLADFFGFCTALAQRRDHRRGARHQLIRGWHVLQISLSTHNQLLLVNTTAFCLTSPTSGYRAIDAIFRTTTKLLVVIWCTVKKGHCDRQSPRTVPHPSDPSPPMYTVYLQRRFRAPPLIQPLTLRSGIRAGRHDSRIQL